MVRITIEIYSEAYSKLEAEAAEKTNGNVGVSDLINWYLEKLFGEDQTRITSWSNIRDPEKGVQP